MPTIMMQGAWAVQFNMPIPVEQVQDAILTMLSDAYPKEVAVISRGNKYRIRVAQVWYEDGFRLGHHWRMEKFRELLRQASPGITVKFIKF